MSHFVKIRSQTMLLITQLLKTKASRLRWLSGAVVAATLSGCGGSSSDTDSTGYIKFYNASSNSPYIYVELDDANYSGASYGQNSSLIEVDSNAYTLSLSWKEGSSDYNTINEQTVQINDDKVSLVVLAGDVENPEVINYQYEYEDPETDEDQLTFRWLNLHSQSQDIDVYLSKDDETFNEAQLLGSYGYQTMSDSHYVELQSYKFYLTTSGSTEVLYESADIPFIYTTQYIMVIRANDGPGESEFTIDKISRYSAVTSYADVDAGAQISLYNGLNQNELLPQFINEVDVLLSSVNGDHTITNLAKGQFSPAMDIADGDYSIDIRSSDTAGEIAKNHFLSLPPNSDRTIFVYLTEQEVEDDDGNEETEIYINTLPIDNSNRVSLYDHQVNVINLVDDYAQLAVYFVKSNETVGNAEYSLQSNRARPQNITLENNSYDISVIARENDSDLLLSFDSLTLDSQSGDIYLVIEEDSNSNTGYTIKTLPQNQ